MSRRSKANDVEPTPNHHGLTKKQHWIYEYAIEQFASDEHQGQVMVLDLASGETDLASPSDPLFYRWRAWSQWVEGKFGKRRPKPERKSESDVLVLCEGKGLKLVTLTDGQVRKIAIPRGCSYVAADDLETLDRDPTWRARVAAGDIVVGHDPRWKRKRDRSQEGLFLRVENDFREVLEHVLASETATVANPAAVSAYLSIWWIRSTLPSQPPDVEIQLQRRPPRPGVHRDAPPIDRWALEKAGCSSARDAAAGEHDAEVRRMLVAGQDFASHLAQMRHDRITSLLGSGPWAVIRATGSMNFICPNRPCDPLIVSGEPHVIPLNRRTALIMCDVDQRVGDDAVGEVNRVLSEQARKFIFGHPDDITAIAGTRGEPRPP